MTEDEALTKWCPFARGIVVDTRSLKSKTLTLAGGVNRQTAAFFSDQTGEPTRCIASACMAWRWLRPQVDPTRTQGYCGLAGQP